MAVNAAIRSLQIGNNAPVISAATGTGKSVIIARLIQRLSVPKPDLKVIVAVHVSELVYQNSKKLRQVMPDADIGIYSAGLGLKQRGSAITFAGIQSIYRMVDVPMVHLLIVDEAHSIGRKNASMWQSFIKKLREKNPNLKIIGLSATPFRMDSGNLTSGDDAIFDDLCFDYGIGRAVQDGWLTPIVSKHTSTQYDVSKVGKLAGEFNLKELEAATNIDSQNKAAVDEIIEKGKDRRSWLVFCNGVAHSFAIRDEMRRRGVTCETVTGETDDNLRAQILRDFQSGDIKCVTNNAVWTTGVDVPGVDLIAMLRHTMSGGLLLQMAGRGTRPVIDLSGYGTSKERRDVIKASLKPNCLMLDFAGNIYRHGFLDQIKGRDKGEKKPGIAPMKFCPECATICHAAAKKCPDCGFEFPMEKKEILGESYDGAVLSSQNKPEWKGVINVEYIAHNLDRDGKTPSMRVIYTMEDYNRVSEYICLQHTGFARTKAIAWWNLRGGDDVENIGVQLIVSSGMCQSLKRPSKILVGKDGKYDRVFDYDFNTPPPPPASIGEASSLDMMEDISF